MRCEGERRTAEKRGTKTREQKDMKKRKQGLRLPAEKAVFLQDKD